MGVSSSGLRSTKVRSCTASQSRLTCSSPRRAASSSIPRSVKYTPVRLSRAPQRIAEAARLQASGPGKAGGRVPRARDVCGHVSADVPLCRRGRNVCPHVSADVPARSGTTSHQAVRAPVDNGGCLARKSGTLICMAAQTQETELDVRMPFSRADARRAGIPVKHLTSARFRKLFHDLYICADVPVTQAVLASAALRISPAGSHTSHFTAAEIWGGVVPSQPLTHVSSRVGCTRSERQGVGSHESSRGSQVVTFRGLRLSSPERPSLMSPPRSRSWTSSCSETRW